MGLAKVFHKTSFPKRKKVTKKELDNVFVVTPRQPAVDNGVCIMILRFLHVFFRN